MPVQQTGIARQIPMTGQTIGVHDDNIFGVEWIDKLFYLSKLMSGSAIVRNHGLQLGRLWAAAADHDSCHVTQAGEAYLTILEFDSRNRYRGATRTAKGEVNVLQQLHGRLFGRLKESTDRFAGRLRGLHSVS